MRFGACRLQIIDAESMIGEATYLPILGTAAGRHEPEGVPDPRRPAARETCVKCLWLPQPEACLDLVDDLRSVSGDVERRSEHHSPKRFIDRRLVHTKQPDRAQIVLIREDLPDVVVGMVQRADDGTVFVYRVPAAPNPPD